MSPWDPAGEGAELHAFDECPLPDSVPPKTCDNAAARECDLLQYVDVVGTDLPDKKRFQNRYLMYLVRRYRVQGLTAMEMAARRRLEELRYEVQLPKANKLYYSLDWAMDQATHCLRDQALATIAPLEQDILARPDTPERRKEVVQVLLARARIGDKRILESITRIRQELAQSELMPIARRREELARIKLPHNPTSENRLSAVQERIAQLRREQLAHPPAPGDPATSELFTLMHLTANTKPSYARLTIAKAAAEIGEHDLAQELVSEGGLIDGSEAKAKLAQIAVRHGNIERAIALVDNDAKSENLSLLWTQFFARLGIVQVLVWRGEQERAETLAARWNAYDVPKSKYYTPPRIRADRIVALEMAKHAPLAALNYVREREWALRKVNSKGAAHDTSGIDVHDTVCSGSLAVIGARAGFVDQALQILNTIHLEKPPLPGAISLDLLRQRRVWGRSLLMYVTAAVETAIAFQEKGDEAKAKPIIDNILMAAEAGTLEDPHKIHLAALMARVAPKQAVEYLKRANLSRFLTDPRVTNAAASSFLRRGRMGEALAFYDELVATLGDGFTDSGRGLMHNSITGRWSNRTDTSLFFRRLVFGRGFSIDEDYADCPVGEER